MRTAEVTRQTKETDIKVKLSLDGGEVSIDSGIGFFDHMLTALAVHSGIGLSLSCKGDINVDCHHSIEDCGIVIGKAIAEALGDKGGICRYGSFYIPMDEALGFCSMDISGRAYLVFNAEFKSDKIGEMDSQMVVEFFRAVAYNAGITLHLRCEYGNNDHHIAEALFKAFAHAFKQAIAPLGDNSKPLSTKGVL